MNTFLCSDYTVFKEPTKMTGLFMWSEKIDAFYANIKLTLLNVTLLFCLKWIKVCQSHILDKLFCSDFDVNLFYLKILSGVWAGKARFEKVVNSLR